MFVMVFVIYLWFICDVIRIFCNVLFFIYFFSRVISLFLYNAFEVILNDVVGLGLFLWPQYI